MKKIFKKISMVMLAILLIFPVFALSGCWCNCWRRNIEFFPFVIGVDEINGDFNPFTSAHPVDRQIISKTQMPLARLNTQGTWLEYGSGIPVATKALKVEKLNSSGQVISESVGNDGVFESVLGFENSQIAQTRLTFVLKDSIYFSDGMPLTLKDVFFNLYTFLDPSYMGANQLRTINIDGLRQYHNQSPHENIIGWRDQFQWIANIAFSEFRGRLSEFHTAQPGARISVPNLVNSDVPFSVQQQGWLDILLRTYREEVSRHLQNGDIAVPEGHEFISDRLETFLHRVGIARIGPPAGQPGSPDMFDPDGRVPNFRPIYNIAAATGNWEILIEEVMTSVLTTSMLVSNMTFSTSAFNLINYIASQMREAFIPEISIHNIRGIQRIVGERTIGGKTFNSNANEMFSITINGVDPNALFLLGDMTIAPKHIYSGVFEKIDFRNAENWCWYGGDPSIENSTPNGRFGLPFSRASFHREVINSVEVPVGAGAYMATNATFDAHLFNEAITRNQFFSGNTVNLYRNPFFIYGPNNGPARIHRVAMRSRPRAALIPALNAREFHYTVVDAVYRDQSVIATSRDLIGFGEANMGFQYVGINASQIPDIRVRRAIMYVLDPDMTLEYYDGLSTRITRASTTNSWVFDGGMPTCVYPFQVRRLVQVGVGMPGMVTYSSEVARIRNLFQAAGYTLTGGTTIGGIANVDGVLRDSSNQQLRLTFSLPGDTTEHPARDMFLDAARLLRRYFGVNANVVPDPQVFTALSRGELQIWAGEMEQGIDPCMFERFHFQSRHHSVNAFGFNAIMNDRFMASYNNVLPSRNQDFLLTILADYIQKGRQSLDRDVRIPIYRDAHNILMELAVIFPTIQRENMHILNTRIINIASTYQNRSTLRGPMFNFTHWELN
ncbi:MAG: hypothetical protein FWE22_03440 [Firmicutes bacterium]|nr:hypothetical protein [Bacillota bacterium]